MPNQPAPPTPSSWPVVLAAVLTVWAFRREIEQQLRAWGVASKGGF